MSLGDTVYSQSLADAVEAAWNAGVVIVAGAGNDGVTAPFYPAALDHVIAVGAFDEEHQRASFSNYGNWVDIAAPGSNILSTYPLSKCEEAGVPGETGCYSWLSGTSMATPHVAGAAALIWSRGDVTTNAAGGRSAARQRRSLGRVERAPRFVDDARRPQSARRAERRPGDGEAGGQRRYRTRR